LSCGSPLGSMLPNVKSETKKGVDTCAIATYTEERSSHRKGGKLSAVVGIANVFLFAGSSLLVLLPDIAVSAS
jgi:hypothetical protein